MESLRLAMYTVKHTGILFHKQQQLCCVALMIQSQRYNSKSSNNGGITTKMMLCNRRLSPERHVSRGCVYGYGYGDVVHRTNGTRVECFSNKNRLFSDWKSANGNSSKWLLNNRNWQNVNIVLDDGVNVRQKRDFSCNDTQSAKKTEATASSATSPDASLFDETANLGLFAKFKLMYKKYWYVLLPVHVVTSIGWFAGFYYMSKSGVDVGSLLEYLHMSETIIDKVQHSNMGHYAIAYLCYKIATPLRYAVTLGGTTVSIKVLAQAGHIKPVPTKTEFMAMIEKKKGISVEKI